MLVHELLRGILLNPVRWHLSVRLSGAMLAPPDMRSEAQKPCVQQVLGLGGPRRGILVRPIPGLCFLGTA